MEISYRQEVMRKLVHLSSIWMAVVMWTTPRWFCVPLFGTMAILNLAVEYMHYKKVPFITPLYGRFFGGMLRDGNGKFRMSGSPPFLLAACLLPLLFMRGIAVPAFVSMLTADTAAALVGRRFGHHKFSNGKSWEGTCAFICTGCLVVAGGCLLSGFGVKVLACGLAGVAAAAILELYNDELHLDDNLSIPLAVGAGMWLGTLV